MKNDSATVTTKGKSLYRRTPSPTTMPWGQSGEHTMGDNLRDKYRVALSDTARDGDLGFTSTAELKPSEGLDQVIGQRTPLSLLLKTLRDSSNAPAPRRRRNASTPSSRRSRSW